MTARRLAVAVILKLIVTATVVVGMAGVALASAYVTTGRTSLTEPRWDVTVGPPSRTLFPGTDVTMPFEVRNSGSRPQTLHATSAALRSSGDRVYDVRAKADSSSCNPKSFTVSATTPSVGSSGEVAPGATVRGTVSLTLAALPSRDDSCKTVALEIDVAAT